MISSDSCHMSRDRSVSISKPACSYWLERPVPNSDAPFGDEVERGDALGDADRMVELAMRQQHDAVADADASASAPPRRSRKTSGAQECANSVRKWCSTAQTVSKPSRSASSICSSASGSSARSLRSSCGFGVCSS